MTGTVVKLNPKRAVVECPTASWRVPYSTLRHECDTLKNKRAQRMQRLTEVADQARQLMTRYGLSDWSFKFSGARKQLGSCNFTNRQIIVSRIAVINQTPDQITDVILHEIAHALAGWEAGHGPKWKSIAIQLGATPKSFTPLSKEIAEAEQIIKAKIKIGDMVTFEDRNGQIHEGIVLRKNPMTVKIKCPENIWLVPYMRLSMFQNTQQT